MLVSITVLDQLSVSEGDVNLLSSCIELPSYMDLILLTLFLT